MYIDEFGNEEYSEEELDEIIDDYFDPMELDEDQKEERKKLAKEYYALLIFLFLLLQTQFMYGAVVIEEVVNQFRARLKNICFKYTAIDEYITTYIEEVTERVIQTTADNMAQKKYWTSAERAVTIAMEETNTILNHDDLERAKALGYTKKKWLCMKDNKVRKEHLKVEGKIIPIDDKFHVGHSYLEFPRDEVNCVYLGDIANCRCSLKFLAD